MARVIEQDVFVGFNNNQSRRGEVRSQPGDADEAVRVGVFG
jgi:hypothetical protein